MSDMSNILTLKRMNFHSWNSSVKPAHEDIKDRQRHKESESNICHQARCKQPEAQAGNDELHYPLPVLDAAIHRGSLLYH